MDLDGSWKPPESWPESSPPLPGWVRLSDGTWYDPAQQASSTESVVGQDTVAEADVSDLSTTPASRPVPDTAAGATSEPQVSVTPPSPPSTQTEAPARTLQFSETQAVVQPTVEDDQILERAIRAAIIAGVLAAAIGIGLGLLLAAL